MPGEALLVFWGLVGLGAFFFFGRRGGGGFGGVGGFGFRVYRVLGLGFVGLSLRELQAPPNSPSSLLMFWSRPPGRVARAAGVFCFQVFAGG